MKAKYGGGWVLITVSENDLSEELAEYLAREGFNILLVGKP